MISKLFYLSLIAYTPSLVKASGECCVVYSSILPMTWLTNHNITWCLVLCRMQLLRMQHLFLLCGFCTGHCWD